MGPGIAANVPYPDLASLDFGACSITTPSAGCRTASTRGGSPTASRSDWSTTTSTRTTPNLSPRETCSSSRPSTPRAGRTARTKAETQVSFAWWTTERWRFRTTTATGCTSRWATPSPPARWECCSSISRNATGCVSTAWRPSTRATPPGNPLRRTELSSPRSAAVGAELLDQQGQPRARSHRALHVVKQGFTVDRTWVDRRKAPVVERDQLGHDLLAVPDAIAEDRVHAEPTLHVFAHRQSRPGAGGRGKPLTSIP